MREISPENLYLLLLGEHLVDSLCCLSRPHTHTHHPHSTPVHPTSQLRSTSVLSACLPLSTSSSPSLHHLLHSLTPLFPVTLSCSTAISLLHLAIKTRGKAEEKEYTFNPHPSFSSNYCLPISKTTFHGFFFFHICNTHVCVRNPEFMRMAGMELINKGNLTAALS